MLTFSTLTDQLDASFKQERLASALAGFFGVVALLLSGLGVFGMVSAFVEHQRRALAIRAALGGWLIRLVLGHAGIVLLSGTAFGVLLALGTGRLLASLLYQVTSHDAVTLIAAVLLLAMAGVAAAWLPARRAARMDPAACLRAE